MADPSLTDHRYLTDRQYRDASRLVARSSLHERFGRGDWFPWIANLIPWRNDDRMLEIGCGNGCFWTEAADQAPSGLHVALTDLAAAAVTEALSSCQRAETFAAGSVVSLPHLPFTSDSFDIAWTVVVMQHIADPDSASARSAECCGRMERW